jgi:hypothetical protein
LLLLLLPLLLLLLLLPRESALNLGLKSCPWVEKWLPKGEKLKKKFSLRIAYSESDTFLTSDHPLNTANIN